MHFLKDKRNNIFKIRFILVSVQKHYNSDKSQFYPDAIDILANFDRRNGSPNAQRYWHLAADSVKLVLRTNPAALNPQPSQCIKRVNDTIKHTGCLTFCSTCEILDPECEVNLCIKETLKVILIAFCAFHDFL